MSLIQTVMTALGGDFETVNSGRTSFQTNGTHTVRVLRNNNVQVELHDLKNRQSINFIQKGRLGAQAVAALTKAGFATENITVSDGSYDRRGDQDQWRAWPSLYVQQAPATGQDTNRMEALEGQLATLIKAMSVAGTTVEPTTDSKVDTNGDSITTGEPTGDEPQDVDF